MRLAAGLCPGGSLSALSDPLAAKGGLLLRGGDGREREGREEEGKGGGKGGVEGRERGKGEGRGGEGKERGKEGGPLD